VLQKPVDLLQLQRNMQHSILEMLQLTRVLLQIGESMMQISGSARPAILSRAPGEDSMLQITAHLQHELASSRRIELVLLQIEGLMLQIDASGRPRKRGLLHISRCGWPPLEREGPPPPYLQQISRDLQQKVLGVAAGQPENAAKPPAGDAPQPLFAA
jgi:hypothetical protein